MGYQPMIPAEAGLPAASSPTRPRRRSSGARTRGSTPPRWWSSWAAAEVDPAGERGPGRGGDVGRRRADGGAFPERALPPGPFPLPVPRGSESKCKGMAATLSVPAGRPRVRTIRIIQRNTFDIAVRLDMLEGGARVPPC